jgi:hypothetical protein
MMQRDSGLPHENPCAQYGKPIAAPDWTEAVRAAVGVGLCVSAERSPTGERAPYESVFAP